MKPFHYYYFKTVMANTMTMTNVRFTLNSFTRINGFRGFLSQFSTNFHEILHTLFAVHVVTTLKFSILEVRPFDIYVIQF